MFFVCLFFLISKTSPSLCAESFSFVSKPIVFLKGKQTKFSLYKCNCGLQIQLQCSASFHGHRSATKGPYPLPPLSSYLFPLYPENHDSHPDSPVKLFGIILTLSSTKVNVFLWIHIIFGHSVVIRSVISELCLSVSETHLRVWFSNHSSSLYGGGSHPASEFPRDLCMSNKFPSGVM